MKTVAIIKQPRPFILLTIGLMLTLSILLIMGWNIYWENINSKEQLVNQLQAESLRLALYRENRTLSHAALLASDNPAKQMAYRSNYTQHKHYFEKVIDSVNQFTNHNEIQYLSTAIINSRDVLFSIEDKVFESLQQGNTAAANQLLHSVEYQNANNRYEQSALQLVAMANLPLYWLEVLDNIKLALQQQENSLEKAVANEDSSVIEQYLEAQNVLYVLFQDVAHNEQKKSIAYDVAQIETLWKSYNANNLKIIDALKRKDFSTAKALYAGGHYKATDNQLNLEVEAVYSDLAQFLAQHIRTYDLDIILTAITIIFAIFLLAVIWYFVLRAIYHWRNALAESNQQLINLNCELDNKVVQRTEKLQQAYDKLKQEIEEKQLLAVALQESQKLQAVGTLAAGIAHDFNNFLAIILAQSEFLQRQVSAEEIHKAVQSIINSTNKASHLTQQLLTFARRTKHEKQTVDISHCIKEAAAMLQSNLADTIELQTVLADHIWPISADSNQVVQVILNLAFNARDAMPDGGKLILSAQNKVVSVQEAQQVVGLQAGQYVVVTVRDTGQGIKAENMQYIFEPFYTTKAVGKGIGLGLSIAYGIMQLHQGGISVDSTLGKGSSFYLYFPVKIA